MAVSGIPPTVLYEMVLKSKLLAFCLPDRCSATEGFIGPGNSSGNQRATWFPVWPLMVFDIQSLNWDQKQRFPTPSALPGFDLPMVYKVRLALPNPIFEPFVHSALNEIPGSLTTLFISMANHLSVEKGYFNLTNVYWAPRGSDV